MHTTSAPAWWARGLIFENCSCQLVCPGHMHFDQLCTHERCRGFWAFRFDEADVRGVRLDGQPAVIAFDCPQRMIDGGWTQSLIVDDRATDAQRAAMEAVFDGSLGGPWTTLGRFVGERLETRTARIEVESEPMRKRIGVAGLLEATVTAIRGRDRTQPVTFENIFNQIHAPSQVIARGDSRYDDGVIRFDVKGTHGLWSSFAWTVTP